MLFFPAKQPPENAALLFIVAFDFARGLRSAGEKVIKERVALWFGRRNGLPGVLIERRATQRCSDGFGWQGRDTRFGGDN